MTKFKFPRFNTVNEIIEYYDNLTALIKAHEFVVDRSLRKENNIIVKRQTNLARSREKLTEFIKYTKNLKVINHEQKN